MVLPPGEWLHLPLGAKKHGGERGIVEQMPISWIGECSNSLMSTLGND